MSTDPTLMATLPDGPKGYAFEQERHDLLFEQGQEPFALLAQTKENFPKFNLSANPLDVFRILNQRNQGACQGHALAGVFSVIYWLATGRLLAFSRAAAYYLSQRKDGIRGDRGSTLSGGQWVATQHGLCLEHEWPYPNQYDPTEPVGITYRFKAKVTRPLRTLEEVKAWRDSNLPIQIGLPWGSSCNREIVDNWVAGGSGHSTFYWLKSKAGNTNNLNSWGEDWNGDGMHEWTDRAITAALAHPWTVMIGYAPDEMSFPDPEVLV